MKRTIFILKSYADIHVAYGMTLLIEYTKFNICTTHISPAGYELVQQKYSTVGRRADKVSGSDLIHDFFYIPHIHIYILCTGTLQWSIYCWITLLNWNVWRTKSGTPCMYYVKFNIVEGGRACVRVTLLNIYIMVGWKIEIKWFKQIRNTSLQSILMV